jgi:phospholipid transport system transporter-binding protein
VARREGNRLLLDGAVTVGTVPTLLDEGAVQLRDGVEIVDFAGVTEVDSAALALALAWLREARAAGGAIRFANLPRAMENLARLYAVDQLLPIAPAEE